MVVQRFGKRNNLYVNYLKILKKEFKLTRYLSKSEINLEFINNKCK